MLFDGHGPAPCADPFDRWMSPGGGPARRSSPGFGSCLSEQPVRVCPVNAAPAYRRGVVDVSTPVSSGDGAGLHGWRGTPGRRAAAPTCADPMPRRVSATAPGRESAPFPGSQVFPGCGSVRDVRTSGTPAIRCGGAGPPRLLTGALIRPPVGLGMGTPAFASVGSNRAACIHPKGSLTEAKRLGQTRPCGCIAGHWAPSRLVMQ